MWLRRDLTGCGGILELEDHHATVDVVFLGRHLARHFGSITVDREFETGLVATALATLSVLLFALSNLFDDERR
jgi:hypothetical protein